MFSGQQYSGFDPRTVPGCQLWLDAADRNTISFSSGTNVSQWRDKSGSSHIFTSSTTNPVLTVQNNITGISFNGNSYFTNTTTSFTLSSRSVFIVAEQTAQSTVHFEGLILLGFSTTIDDYANTGAVVYSGRGSNAVQNTQFGVYTGGGDYNNNFGVYADGPLPRRIYADVFQTNSGSIFVNGASGTTDTTTATPPTATGAVIASRYYTSASYLNQLNGTIYEIIVFNSALTTSQRQQVEGYLAWKWGLQTSIPTAHPYRGNPLAMRIFQPSDINGLALWLDAADASTFSFSSGSNVSQWRDKSGNGRDVTAVVSPTYNSINRALQFDGTSQYLTLASGSFAVGTYFTVFVVEKLQASVANGHYAMIGGTSSTANQALHMRYGGTGTAGDSTVTTGRFAFGGNDLNILNIPAFTTAAVQPIRIWSYMFTPSFRGAYLNGVLFNSDTNNTFLTAWSSPAIGSSFGGQYYNGNLYEIVFHTGTVTTSQRQQVEGYLAAKWGLSTSLPTTQPYFSLRSLPSTPLFVPTTLSNLTMWLDAADSSTVTFSSGSNVNSWNDKSGNGRNMTPPAVGNAPTYTGNALRFSNASSQRLVGAQSSNLITASQYTIFLVGNPISSPSAYVAGYTNAAFYGDTEGYWSLYAMNTNVVGVYNWDGNADLTQQSYTLNTNGLFTTQHASGAITLRINGNTASSTNSGNTTNLTGSFQLGRQWNRSEHLDCSIQEVIIYNTALTTSQVQAVEGYLVWKWGLQRTLPATSHPYKSFRP